MHSSIAIASVVLIALTACTTEKPRTSDSAAASATIAPRDDGKVEKASQWQVTAAGIGDVRAGMSLDEANLALGNALTIPTKLQECDYVRPKSPTGLAFMVEKGEISRVDVQPGSDVATVAGAKIGDSEDRIKSLYPGVDVKPAKYAPGHYLEVTPSGGSNNRIVFETDGKNVVKYRSGRLPAVEYVEGCG